jgi:hypothetical protein
MTTYTTDDIYMLNAYYLHSCCQNQQQCAFVIDFMRYRGLVQEYIHFLNSGELPSQVSDYDSSEEYLQDTYNY